MKISSKLDISILEKYGFEKIDKEYEKAKDDYTMCDYEYKYEIGHARRGQFYYLLVDENGHISIYASKPDGDGCEVSCPDILIDLIKDGVIESHKEK